MSPNNKNKFILLKLFPLVIISTIILCISCIRKYDNPYDTGSYLIPDAPTSLTARMTNNKKIELKWKDNGNENAFVLYRNGEELCTLPKNTREYLDSTFEFEEEYVFTVAATIANGAISEQTKTTFGTFFKPSGLSIATAKDSILLKWNDQCSFEDGYSIERRVRGEYFVKIGTGDSNTTSFVDFIPNPDNQYEYRVCAIKGPLNSSYVTVAVSFPLSMPTDLSAYIVQEATIKLTWIDNGFDNGYGIFCGRQFVGKTQKSDTCFFDSSFQFDTSLTFSVRALGESEKDSLGASLQIGDSSLLSSTRISTRFTPLNLHGESMADGVRIAWMDSCSFEKGFVVERKKTGENVIVLDTLSANDTGFLDLFHPEKNVQYTWRVHAYAGDRKSSYTVKTMRFNLLAPADFSATMNANGTVQLTWQDNCFEDGYEIYRNQTKIGSLGSNDTSYFDSLYDIDKEYIYSVRSLDTVWAMYKYASVNLSTIFTPLDFIVNKSDTGLRLHWKDVCGFEDGYSIERKIDEGQFLQIGKTSADDTVFFDKDALHNDGNYTYRIQAYKGIKWSSYTPEVSISLLVPPSGLEIQIDSIAEKALLTWKDNSGHEDGYSIEMKTSTVDFVQTKLLAQNTQHYVLDLPLLDKSESYSFRIKAKQGAFYSSASNMISLKYGLTQLWLKGGGTSDNYSSVVISPDGKKVVASNNNKIEMWDVETGAPVPWPENQPSGKLMQFSADGQYFASADGSIISLRNMTSGISLWDKSHSAAINSIHFCGDGSKIVTASADATIKVISVNDGNQLWTGNHSGEVKFREVKSATFSPDDSRVVSASKESVKVWNGITGSLIWQSTSDSVSCALFSPDGSLVSSGGNVVKTWNATTGDLLWTGTLSSENNASCLSYSPDGTMLACGANGSLMADVRDINVWSSQTGNLLWKGSHRYDIHSIQFNMSGDKIVEGSEDNAAVVWDSKTGRKIGIGSHRCMVWAACFSPDGKKVASVSGWIALNAVGELILWKLAWIVSE